MKTLSSCFQNSLPCTAPRRPWLCRTPTSIGATAFSESTVRKCEPSCRKRSPVRHIRLPRPPPCRAFAAPLLTICVLVSRTKGFYPRASPLSIAQLASQLETSAFEECACSDLYVETVYIKLYNAQLSATPLSNLQQPHPTNAFTPHQSQHTHPPAPAQLIVPADWRALITDTHRRNVLSCILHILSSTSCFLLLVLQYAFAFISMLTRFLFFSFRLVRPAKMRT